MFSTFKDTFRNAQIAEISFYIDYLLLIIFFMNIFAGILEIAEDTLKSIEEFMRIFFPTFFLIVGSTVGAGTGLAYYQIAGIVIYLSNCYIVHGQSACDFMMQFEGGHSHGESYRP